MKYLRKLIPLMLAVLLLLLVTACGNRTFIDTTYTFDEAIIELPDGTIVQGEVESWCDYDGDQLQITIDGETYVVHSSNCVLIAH